MRIQLTAMAAILIISSTAGMCISLRNDPPPVGFIWHYPFVDVGTEEIPKSGASTMDSRAVWLAMEREKGKIDFSTIDRQIKFAEKNNIRLALILEMNPFCKPQWVMDEARKADELVKDFFGNNGGFPRHDSKVMRDAQEEFLRRLTEHLKIADRNHVITHYHPGIEWWFPYDTRYAKESLVGFRRWLTARYQTVANLNRSWKSSYGSFDEAEAPAVEVADLYTNNRSGISRVFDIRSDYGECIWKTKAALDLQIAPGTKYEFSAWVKTDRVLGRGVFLETAWHDTTGKVFSSIRSGTAANTSSWKQILLPCTAPPNAVRASLYLHFQGLGDARFDDISFRMIGSTANSAPNPGFEIGDALPDLWENIAKSGSKMVTGRNAIEGRSGSGGLIVSMPSLPSRHNYRNINAVYNDWYWYWSEESAKYINSLAAMVKKYDTTRKTVSFLTFSSALPAEWDYVQWSSTRLDEVAMRGKDIDVLGMQLPMAEGDPYRISAALDTARKYGKPMWDLDLLDFVAGVAIGKSAMMKGSHAAIQHGATGLQYCCWNGAKDFMFYPDWSIEDLNSMITESKRAINLVASMKIRPKAAIILPILPSSPIDKSGTKNSVESFIGWYKILEQTYTTVDVVTLRELDRNVKLAQYDWILVPDCAYISQTSLDRLASYMDDGGMVVSGGRFARYDDIGGKADADITPSCTLPDYGKQYTGVLNRNNHAGDTPPMMIWRAETESTKRTLRSAKSALTDFLVTNDLGNDYQIISGGSDIRCVEMGSSGKRCLYLVNMSGGRASNVSLRFGSGSRGFEIYADTIKQNGISDKNEIGLPSFDTSCIVMFDR